MEHNLSRVEYAGLNAELGVPLLHRKCSNCFGIRLWLLKDPSVTWTDLAVALYNLNIASADEALKDLKQKYLPNTGQLSKHVKVCELVEYREYGP